MNHKTVTSTTLSLLLATGLMTSLASCSSPGNADKGEETTPKEETSPSPDDGGEGGEEGDENTPKEETSPSPDEGGEGGEG
jgi:hypothetical protein